MYSKPMKLAWLRWLDHNKEQYSLECGLHILCFFLLALKCAKHSKGDDFVRTKLAWTLHTVHANFRGLVSKEFTKLFMHASPSTTSVSAVTRKTYASIIVQPPQVLYIVFQPVPLNKYESIWMSLIGVLRRSDLLLPKVGHLQPI